MRTLPTRREFVATLAWAGAASVVSARGSLADEPPPEVTTLRLAITPATCTAPVYIADEMLRAEGFTDIRYVLRSHPDDISAGRMDFDQDSGAWLALLLDAGEPLALFAGLHPCCVDLFVLEPTRTIPD